jgi:hypothetical protein
MTFPIDDHEPRAPRLIEAVRRARDSDGVTPAEFAARHLGVPARLVFSASQPIDRHTHVLLGRTLAIEVARFDDAVPGPADEREPTWRLLELGDDTELIPASASFGLPAGALAPFPIVLRLTMEWPARFEVLASLEHAWAAQEDLTRLVRRSRVETNPFRGRVVRADHDNALELHLTAAPVARRDDVWLPDATWRTIDRHVHHVIDRADELIAAGLGANRGILLAGPPGTGKTTISRVVAAELAGRATVILCSPEAATYGIEQLYREAVHLAPAVVIIEDLDLIAGDRRQYGSHGLQQFLVALDGVATTGACIVTLASTNDVAAIDEAARRAARFDVVLEVPLPDREARAHIVAVYLRDVAHDVDVEMVARSTGGASAADLRELVRRSVIEDDGRVTTEAMVARARAGRRADEGLYL